MKFDEVWNHLCRKDPRLEKDSATVEFRADNLRKLLRQVHGLGETEGRDIGRAEGIREQQRKYDNAGSGSGKSGMFGDLFGGL